MSFARSAFVRYDMYNGAVLLASNVLTVLLIRGSVGQDISFPSENLTDAIQQFYTTSEAPSTTPEIPCDANMIPVDWNETESFCECVEGYLYHPKSDKCYKPYTKGPCEDGKMLVLRGNQTMAKCVRNPCRTENEVPYKASCHGLLLSGGPCSENEALVISEKSYEPACERIGTVTYQVITVPIKTCAPGSRRAGRGLCRTIL